MNIARSDNSECRAFTCATSLWFGGTNDNVALATGEKLMGLQSFKQSQMGEKIMSRVLLLVGLVLAVSNANAAGVSCSERITALIPHKDGHIFFNTSQTSGWAKLDWADDIRKDRGNAALLTAFTTGKTVEFYWPQLNSCAEKNALYASPDYFIVRN